MLNTCPEVDLSNDRIEETFDFNETSNSSVSAKHYSHVCDIVLVIGYLHVATNVITRNDKKGNTFWNKIVEHFNERTNQNRAPKVLNIIGARLTSNARRFVVIRHCCKECQEAEKMIMIG